MTSSAFPSDWIKKFSDPYAILGVSVTADERRIAKRYRQVAKQLHPDQQLNADEVVREFAGQILTRLVNPAYQRIKQDKGRLETLATLRFKVRRLSREQKLIARIPAAKQLMEADEAAVDILYEKALSDLSETQYVSADEFAKQTAAISELNLIYLRCKMGDPVIREKRTGLVSAGTIQQPPPVSPPPATTTVSSTGPPVGESTQISYAQRHINRAKAYITNKSYPQAIKELRDAVRIEPDNSNYHAMLGQAYLLQKMGGMAKVHLRQALKLDPNNAVALKYARKLEINLDELTNRPEKNGNGHRKGGGLFKFFSRKQSTK
ncbi:MAG: DnaJ domain-containing protein [Leptolyngbya sp. SIO1E4]|nr:DnaJ domain-containing protein [Leptolyngbya sp. SIO1E4]